MKITTIGLDIAKSVFHLFAVNRVGKLIKKKQLKRKELLAYIAQLESCRIVMEACGVHTIGQENLLPSGTR